VDVRVSGPDAQLVAGTVGDENAVGPESPAQPGNVVLDDLRGGRGRPLAPELVHQPFGRDGLVGLQEEQGEQCTLLAAAKRDRAAAVAHLQRAEDEEFHRRFAVKYGSANPH
jgi:hypothetical protein